MTPLGSVPATSDGEAFDSFLERTAAVLNVPVTDVLHAAGLAGDGKIAAAWGCWLFDDQLDQAARVLRTPPQRIKAMTVRRYEAALTDTPGSIRTPADLTHLAARSWFYLAGSRYCPHCIARDGRWQISWRLPWTLACRQHRILLSDRCPACGSWPRSGARRGMSSRTFLDRARTPTLCYSSPTPDGRRDGRAAGPCGGDLTAAMTRPAHSTVITAQVAALSCARGTRRVTIVGQAVDAPQALAAWREVYGLLDHAAIGAPAHHVVVPRDTERAATLLPTVHDILAADTIEHAGRRLLNAIEEPHRPDYNWFRDRLPAAPSPTTRRLITEALRQCGRFSTRLRRAGDHPGPPLPLYRYTTSQLPQLFWTCSLPASLHAPPGKPSTPMRGAFVSLSLARLVTGGWPDAAEALGWNRANGTAWAKYVIRHIPAHRRDHVFADIIHAANLMATCPASIDFSPTRSHLSPRQLEPPACAVRQAAAWCPCVQARNVTG